MSDWPQSTPPTSPLPLRPQPSGGGPKGLAITALVFAILGLIIPLFGIVGLILGIIALTRSDRGQTARGIAIGATIVSAVAFVFSCILSIGILLPALGKARQSARQLKSEQQLTQIGTALRAYASDNAGWYPEVSTGWEQRLVPAYINNPAVFDMPQLEPGQGGYIYLPGFNNNADPRCVVALDDPAMNRDRGANVLFGDGSVEPIFGGDFWERIATFKGPDGASIPVSPSAR